MGKQDPQSPTPVPFYPISIDQTAAQATQADQDAFARSDADFASRFPGLVAGQNAQLDQDYKNLTGPLDPTLQNSFVTQGLAKSLNAFGGNSGTNATTEGSIGKNAISGDVANSVLANQDYNRNVFNQDVSQNPLRAIGPSGSDAVSWLIKNTGDQNQINQTNYAGSVNTANAQNAADASNTQAEVGTGIAVASIIAVLI